MQVVVKSFIAYFISALLVFAFVPSVAYADNENGNSEASTEIKPAAESTSDPQKENSFRYVDGERMLSDEGANAESIDPESSENSLSTFSVVTNPEGYKVFNWFDKFSQGFYTGTNAYKGIDVSEHNGSIDWKKVKASGVDYAIIRCGYGQDITSQDDDYWKANVKGCIDNGISFGVYIYSYATNTAKASSEADHALRCLRDAGLSPEKLGYPVYFDMEDKSTIGSDYAAIATTFCNKIQAAGYTPGIYANKSWFNSKLTASCFDNWTKWVAEWNASKGLTYSKLSSFTSGNGMWQFSDYGTVPGINSKAVDLDYTFMKSKNSVDFASISTSGMLRNATGGQLSPTISVKIDRKTLQPGTDYTIIYKKQGSGSESTTAPSEVGTYDVYVRGAGSYVGDRYVGAMTIRSNPNIDGSIACTLSSVADAGLILDASGGTPRRGSNVSIWSNNGGSNQMWYISPDGNGYFVVKNAANQDYLLDASGSSPQRGSNVSVWTNNSGNNQRWVIEESEGAYVLRNAANNDLVLDASGSTPKSGSNVSVWSSNGGKNQKWQITAMNDLSAAQVSTAGMVRNATGQQLKITSLTVTLGGKRLTEGTDYTILYDGSATPPSSAGNHNVIVQGKGIYKGTKSVGTMRIIDMPSISSQGQYYVRSASNADYVLDAAGSTPRLGSNISIWTNNSGSNQKWNFVLDESTGFYTIKNAGNQNFILDASGSTPRIGANVIAWTSNDGLNQKWVIEPIGDDNYIFRNAANPNLILDASGSTPRIGANVTVWAQNGGNNQKWILGGV